MAPDESIIFLLNLYLPNSSNLPAYYLDEIVVPDVIAFEVDGRRVVRPLRRPLGESAARKSLTWGWYSQ
jgi:hypothetical protein